MTGIISGSMTKDDVTAVNVPQYHPPQENLVDYVSGRGGDGWDLIIEAHLSLCAECRAEVGRLKALGGALLEKLPAEDLPEGMEERVLDLLDSAEITTFPGSKCENSKDLPLPVAQLIPDSLDETEWRHGEEGTAFVDLPVLPIRMLLVRISAGKMVGIIQEYDNSAGQLLVLSGGLEGNEDHLLAGDLKPMSDLKGDFYAGGSSEQTFCLLLIQDGA
ncbi:hypothetical protein [Kiloniella sp.]|uniref:hypothetical protein n=1 Tax=Kiloniella sp. TaxID=1938587 RepID=UPI003B012E38